VRGLTPKFSIGRTFRGQRAPWPRGVAILARPSRRGDRITIPFAAVHESGSGTKLPIHDVRYSVAIGCKADAGWPGIDAIGRVEMWRGGCRLNISVSASFVWRCLSGSAMTPFSHPAHRTGQANLSHPALGQDFTPSPTARRVQAQLSVRARSARRGARVDKPRPYVA
jgi:hypothetical protein